MKLLIQRVKSAQVISNGTLTGKIGQGIVIFFGAHHLDTEKQIPPLAEKVSNLRIFSNINDKMNLSIKDIDGEVLIVSQFTLYGTCNKGRRPEFTKSAKPELAKYLYDNFIYEVEKNLNKKVATGIFQAHMEVSLVNNGPATFIIEQ